MDIKETNKRVIEQFRAGGEIDAMRRDRLILLTTVGAKSGLRHTTPMMSTAKIAKCHGGVYLAGV